MLNKNSHAKYHLLNEASAFESKAIENKYPISVVLYINKLIIIIK